MYVVELVQHLAQSSSLAPAYLGVVELTARRGKRIQEGRRVLADKGRKHIYQHLLVRSQVGDDVLHGPETTNARSFRIPFWKLCEGLQDGLLAVLENIDGVHRQLLSLRYFRAAAIVPVSVYS